MKEPSNETYLAAELCLRQKAHDRATKAISETLGTVCKGVDPEPIWVEQSDGRPSLGLPLRNQGARMLYGVAVRCPRCLGMGYKGRWRRGKGPGGKVWRIETCSACRGSGEKPDKRQDWSRGAPGFPPELSGENEPE